MLSRVYPFNKYVLSLADIKNKLGKFEGESKMAKNLAEKKNTAIAVGNFEDDAGKGFEEADANSFAIPFLVVLQKGSKAVDEDSGVAIEGAKAGMLFDTVSEAMYPADEEKKEPGMLIIPCAYKRFYIEWGLREDGGGFVAQYDAAEGEKQLATTSKDDKNRDVLPNGNQLVNTPTHYVLAINPEGDVEPMVLALTSTQLKKSRKWMTVMNNLKMKREDGSKFTPPMFSHTYKITTVPESNDKGNWRGAKIVLDGVVENGEWYNAAKAFRDQISKDQVTVNHAATQDSDAAPSDAGDGAM